MSACIPAVLRSISPVDSRGGGADFLLQNATLEFVVLKKTNHIRLGQFDSRQCFQSCNFMAA